MHFGVKATETTICRPVTFILKLMWNNCLIKSKTLSKMPVFDLN